MKFFLPVLVFGLSVSCSDQAKVANPSDSFMTDEGGVKCKVFTIPFYIKTPIALSPANVIENAKRKILINYPEREPLVGEWRKITQNVFHKPQSGDHGGDMRIVFVLDGDTYSFSRVERGYLNGKPVLYTPAVEEWVQKYLHPLVGN